MADSAAQPNFDQRSFEEFKERLLAELSALERSVTAIRELCSQKLAPPTALPCGSCPKSETPHKPCKRLEAYLDGAYKGRLHGETTIGVNLDEVRDRKTPAVQDNGGETTSRVDRGALRGFRKVEPFDAMESYKPCWHLLTLEQREVVYLHHGEGKGKSEIAVLLGRRPSSVSGRLKRAEKVKEEYDAKMRRQELRLQRELEAKSSEI